MADSTARPLALVTTARATTAQGEFAAHVQAILAQHGDIASEACWQAMAQLIAQEWTLLCQDQAPVQTWGMLARCSETILKLRRGQKQGQDSSGQDELEAFREMMRHIAGEDDER